MKVVICDCCGTPFSYGELTAKTDGTYATVKRDMLNVRVSVDVKAHNGIEHADICPSCRVKALEEYLGQHISGHQECRPNIY